MLSRAGSRRGGAMLVLQMCIAAACMLQSRASSLSPVLPLVRNPAVFQLDARIATRELSLRKGSPATLNDLTDDELDDFAEAGFDAIYLMGVWQTGENGVLNAQKRLLAQRAQSAERMGDTADCTMEAVAEGLDAAGSDTIAGSAPGGSEAATAAEAAAAAAEEAAILAQTQLERDLPGQAPLDSAVGFPTAIIDYSVNTKLGGNNALAALRTRLRERGLRLLLDFVPNHMAADHPWTVTNPQLLVRGSVDDLKREPQNYYQVGEGGLGVFAHGRDPYFDGWEDTVQLNYASAELRQEMCETLARIATMCDGVRCDMAMLQCPSVFQQTWATHLEPQGFDFACLFEPDKLFWPAAIAAARAVNKDFLLVGEVYWGREYDLQQYGFDYTLDKVAYEQLQEGRADDFRQHLARDDAAFLLHSARYLETHEEKRASEVFSDEHEEAGTYRHFAAAIAAYTLPGMRLFNDGQLQGRKLQIPLFLAWRDNAEKRDSRVSAWYSRLLSSVLSRPEVREGEWAPCITGPSMDGNPSWQNMIAHVMWDRFGNALLVIVNYHYEYANGHVTLPEGVLVGRRCFPVPNCFDLSGERGPAVQELPNADVEEGPQLLMRDLLSSASFEREAAVLRGRHGGVWFDLKPWQAHIFELSML